jgi:aryl-alcohol dehydrogenase-like predicted oxidoreductase
MPSNSVQFVPLGKNGPMVPALGLGLMGMSYETYGTVAPDEERLAFLDRAYELGARNWDSSE